MNISLLRKIIVLAIGVPLFILGLILIPLPGPGLLVSFAALAILSREFESARKYRDMAYKRIVGIYRAAKEKSDNIAAKS